MAISLLASWLGWLTGLLLAVVIGWLGLFFSNWLVCFSEAFTRWLGLLTSSLLGLLGFFLDSGEGALLGGVVGVLL